MNSWEDVTIARWKEIQKALTDEMPELEGKREQIQDYARGIKVLSVLLDEDYQELKNRSFEDIEKLMKEYSWVFQHPDKRKVDRWQTFKIVYDINKASAGQFIDMDTLAERGNGELEEFMAILASSDMYPDFKERAEYIRENMPITIAMTAYDFFLRRMTLFAKLFPRYLVVKLTMMKWKLRLKYKALVFKMRLSGILGSKQSSPSRG